MTEKARPTADGLTGKILLAMIAGIIVGLGLRFLAHDSWPYVVLVEHLFDALGGIFIRLMQMLVVPLVFVSLVCGVLNLGGGKALGRIGGKALLIYLCTTAVAVSVALFLASAWHVGGSVMPAHVGTATVPVAEKLTLKALLLRLIPANPIEALAEGNMLQVIFFALLFGLCLSATMKKGHKLADIFQAANEVFIKLILLVMRIAPYAVFCLIAKIFAQVGFAMIAQLAFYFATILTALCVQFCCTYGALLVVFGRHNPLRFVQKILPALLFAFSTSSSNATIPVTLRTVVERLKVRRGIAAFIVPLGATINMDGTAIMQGVATVFIANVYHIPLSFWQLLTVVLTATLASVGAAGVPSAGMFTLAIILRQAGLPMEGIALIVGVDRLLDMTRTAVNVAGDCVVTYILARDQTII